MKKIAVIQDLSGLGKCSLTAAIPVISVMGVQAVPFPTAVLSNQTGYPSYYCDDYTEHMEQIMTEWEKRKFSPDGIYTGFLADEEQADKILDFLRRFRTENTMVLVDPVMGDNGSAYGIYTEGLREKMLQLVRNAHVITPNLTEALLLLYGKEEMEKRYASLLELDGRKRLEQIGKIGEQLVEEYGLKAAVITGVEYEKAGLQIGNLAVENGHASWCFAPKNGGSYSGTGDLFASVLSAGLVKGMSMMSCVQMAVNFLSKAIAETVQEGTDRNDGVCFEKFLGELCKEQ
nr:pyridoxamine kinase [uncultured Blautia sp.]